MSLSLRLNLTVLCDYQSDCCSSVETRIATLERPQHDIFFANQSSTCCCRKLCPLVFPFRTSVSFTNQSVPIAQYERPLACPAFPCKCCCHQVMYAKDPHTGESVGVFKETCYFCIPKFHLVSNGGRVTNVIHVPICCTCCPNICAEGCCRVPFYIYSKQMYNSEVPDGKIFRLRDSIFSDAADTQQIECSFPADSTYDEKAVLLGGAFLLNELYFTTVL